MRGALLVTLTVLAAGLAGCVGSDSGPSAAPSEAGGDADAPDAAGDDERASTAVEASRLTYDAGNGTETIWANGSFAPQEACIPSCFTGDATRTVDLTGIVPADAPVRVHVELTWEEIPNYQPFGAWLQTSEATFYGYDSSFEPGQITLDALLVRSADGTVAAAVQLCCPLASPGASPNTDYTLRVTGTPVPATVDRGVPVEVPLEPGQNLTAEIGGQDAEGDADGIAFRVYGPDDAAVAYVETSDDTVTWTVPSNLSSGRYVVANSWTSDLTLTTAGAEPMRALTIDWTLSEPTTYPGTGAVTWEFDVDRDPLWAGIYVRDRNVGQGLNGPWATLSGFDATLTLPGGGTASGTWSCTPCLNVGLIFGGAYLGFGPARADPGLVAGTYQAELSSDAAVDFEYGHIVAHHVR